MAIQTMSQLVIHITGSGMLLSTPQDYFALTQQQRNLPLDPSVPTHLIIGHLPCLLPCGLWLWKTSN